MSHGHSRLRIAVYTHDTFGLGHLRRCSHIIRALSQRVPDAAILLVTGSPALHAVSDLPQNVDVIKIPTIVQTGSKLTQPPHLPIERKEITGIRKRLVRSALQSFQPDVFLVDNFPLGSRKELSDTLEMLREGKTRSILGLRDIVDRPEVVQATWRKEGIYEVLDQLYDRVLVYGLPEVMDVVAAYDLPPGIASKVSYAGYVTDPGLGPGDRAAFRRQIGVEGPLVLATVGGGGDGYPLLHCFLQAAQRLPEVAALAITGPLMAPGDRTCLRALADRESRLAVREFVPDLPSYLAAADVVVAMGGYNTTAELIALRRRAIVVPRTWRYGEYTRGVEAGAEWEQLLRGRAMEKIGLAEVILPEELDPALLAERMCQALSSPTVQIGATLDTGGVNRAAEEILNMAREGKADDVAA